MDGGREKGGVRGRVFMHLCLNLFVQCTLYMYAFMTLYMNVYFQLCVIMY